MSKATSPGNSDSTDSNFDANGIEIRQCLHDMHVIMALVHIKTAYLINSFTIPYQLKAQHNLQLC